MSKEKKFIGFDLGAESGRCTVGILNKDKITLHEVYRFLTHNIKYENGFHWDILAIYNEIIKGLINAQKEFGSEYDGIGIDSWAVDYVLIDVEGRILGYPYHYRDDRTDNIMVQAFQIVPGKEIYFRSGIQFAQFNTIFQLLSEKKRKQNLLNIADKMLLIPDFLNYLLSGKIKAEFTNASTTSLVDPNKRKWSMELIKAFGFPEKIFPEIVEPGTILGTLLPSIAELVGLDHNIPVISIASHDTASAVVSVPAFEDNWAFLSSGTWSLIGVELKQPLISSEAMEHNFTNEGGFENTFRFLKNIIGLWPIQECKRYWQKKSKGYDYLGLTSLAEDFGSANAWVDLNDPRFLKAGDMPGKIISYLKESGQQIKQDDIGFIIRVILESLALSYREALKEIEIITGKKITSLYAVGGGTRNKLLIQLTANAINRKVVIGPVEGTIFGNIGVQAISTGFVKNLHAWRSIVANSSDLEIYTPQNPDYFNENEQKYKNIVSNSYSKSN